MDLQIGYTHFFGKYNFKDASWLPIAAAARYGISDQSGVGVDLECGSGISPSVMDGGFYYAPQLQYGLTPTVDLVLAYRSISVHSSNFSQLTFGGRIWFVMFLMPNEKR